MFIQWHQLHSTLVYLVRLEMERGNIDQAKFHLTIAWKLRSSAPNFVVNRIIFFIILLKMLKQEPFDIWLSVLKQNINKDKDLMNLEMDFVLKKYYKRLEPKNIRILKFLIALLSTGNFPNQPELIQQWNNTEPISEEYWPEYK
jgi:hypothetical protein